MTVPRKPDIVYIHYLGGRVTSEMKYNRGTCYCIGIRRAANAVTSFYDSALEPTGLTVNQFSLLKNLDCLGSGSISDIAAYVGLERTTLTRTLKPLAAGGYIQDVSERGRRGKKLQLTDLGKETLNKGIPLWESVQSEIENRLGKENLQWLFEITEKL